MEEGVVINRTAAQQGKIPLAAWDIGNFDDSRFLSTEPNPQLSVARKDDLRKIWNGTRSKSYLAYLACARHACKCLIELYLDRYVTMQRNGSFREGPRRTKSLLPHQDKCLAK